MQSSKSNILPLTFQLTTHSLGSADYINACSRHIFPHLSYICAESSNSSVFEPIHHSHFIDGSWLHLLANLSSVEKAQLVARPEGSSIWGGEPGDSLPPWSVFWRLGG